MDRIERERDAAESRLRTAVTEDVEVTAALEGALLLAANCRRFYSDANPALRRLLNQAFFDKLYLSWDDSEVLVGEVAAVDLFTVLFDPESFERLSAKVHSEAGPRNRSGLKCKSRRPTLVASATLNGLSSCNEHLVHLTAQLLNFRPKMDRVMLRIENPGVGRESDYSPFLH